LVWAHDTGDVAYDARLAHDQDGDGVPDVAAVGGDGQPFAALLSGADGSELWSVPLDGPGAVVLPTDDVDASGMPDLAVGQFADPLPCVLALRGEDGARLWASGDVRHDVTSLALADDMLDTGLRDIVVGSFDNATSALLALNGVSAWRREGSPNNGGAQLSAVPVGDLDGDGHVEVASVSVDHTLYVMAGVTGQFMADRDLGNKGAAVLALGDGNGDGRAELVAAGVRILDVLDGNAGLADGPYVQASLPHGLTGEAEVLVWALPQTGLLVLGSVGTGSLPLPAGWGGSFGLDPSSLFAISNFTAPGAGISGFQLGPFDQGQIGVTVYVQAISIYAPGQGLLSNVGSFTIAP
jgi:hypothetical protein